MEIQNKEISMIIKEKKIILTGIGFGLFLFLVYLMFLYLPLFVTDTNILVRNIPKQSIALGEYSPIIRSESGFSNPLINILKIFESDKLAVNIYDRLNKDYPKDMKKFGLKTNEKWPLILNNKLMTASVEPSTDIINVKLNWVNKKNSHKVLESIIDEFKEVNLEIRKSVEKKQRLYLEDQLDEFEKELAEVRDEVMNYKLSNAAFNMKSESVQLNNIRIDFNKRAELLKSQIEHDDKKLEDFSRQLGFEDAKTALRASAVGEDQYLSKLNQDLTTAEQKYAYLTAKYTKNYPEVKAVKGEIKAIKKNLEKRHKESLQDVVIKRGIYDKPSQDLVTEMARTQAEKVARKAELIALEESIETILEKESEIPTKLLSLEDIENKEKILTDTYNIIKKKHLNAIVKENEIVDNIVMLSQGSPPKFVWQSLFMKFMIFLVFGTLLGYSAAHVKEEIEDKWSNPDEIEKTTGKKVIGIIPWIKSKELIENEFIFSSDNLMGMAYSNITRKLISSSYQEEAQSISFISTVYSRNKSSVIPNIAANIAKLHKSVVLVDTASTQELNNDKEMPSKDILDVIDEINKTLRLSGSIDKETISELLKQAIIPVDILLKNQETVRYYDLSLRKNVLNLQEYVATKGFEILIENLKETFEFVLIDTPAKSIILPEVAAITCISDATVIVPALQTNRRELLSTIKKLEESSNKILGILPRETDSELEKVFEQEISKTNEVKDSSEKSLEDSLDEYSDKHLEEEYE